jgi:hypothetical protein
MRPKSVEINFMSFLHSVSPLLSNDVFGNVLDDGYILLKILRSMLATPACSQKIMADARGQINHLVVALKP